MAVRGSKVAAIREYIEQNPKAKQREIVEALAKRRIKVSSSQVYGVLSNGTALKPAPAAAPAVREEGSLYTPTASNGHEKVADQPLLHAKDFARVCGGIAGARKVLDTLDSLQV